MEYARGRTRHIFFRFTCGDYHKRHRIKALVRTQGYRSVAVRMVNLTASCCGLADSLSMHIPRAILPQDPEDFRQDRRDRTLPVGRSVWTTCGHVVSVRNELALAVRFE